MKVATIFAEQPVKVARRYLAPNVIALWPEDRPPVVNQRHRGRYPSGVVMLRRWDRLHPGDYAYMWGSCTPQNRGVVVRLLKQYSDGDWEIQGADRDLLLTDGRLSRQASAKPENLRRCAAPKA